MDVHNVMKHSQTVHTWLYTCGHTLGRNLTNALSVEKDLHNKEALNTHKSSVHAGEKPHKCAQCGQRFAQKCTLRNHIASVHTGEKPHACTQCGQRFTLKTNLKNHITSIHTGEKPHECTQCG